MSKPRFVSLTKSELSTSDAAYAAYCDDCDVTHPDCVDCNYNEPDDY